MCVRSETTEQYQHYASTENLPQTYTPSSTAAPRRVQLSVQHGDRLTLLHSWWSGGRESDSKRVTAERDSSSYNHLRPHGVYSIPTFTIGWTECNLCDTCPHAQTTAVVMTGTTAIGNVTATAAGTTTTDATTAAVLRLAEVGTVIGGQDVVAHVAHVGETGIVGVVHLVRDAHWFLFLCL
jgi:hypothetical protein